MKDNVDLTENNDFKIKASDFINEPRLKIYLTHNKRFGVFNDEYYISSDSGAIRQGNRLERLSKRSCEEFGRGRYCDCCGKELKPYINDCLCEKCNEYMNNKDYIFKDFI